MVDEQNILTRESEPKKCIVVSIGEMTIRMKGYYFLDNKISVLKPCLEECFESVLEQFCSFFSLIEYCVWFYQRQITDPKICLQRVLVYMFATEELNCFFRSVWVAKDLHRAM